MGCAMAAAVCAGQYKDYADAAGHMVKVKAVIQPELQMHKNIYGKICPALLKLWRIFTAR